MVMHWLRRKFIRIQLLRQLHHSGMNGIVILLRMSHLSTSHSFLFGRLVTDIPLKDLRRESRLSVTFYAYNDRKDLAVALGGTTLALFDHTDALVSGVQKLRLWFVVFGVICRQPQRNC
jgi:hypothetical protein